MISETMSSSLSQSRILSLPSHENIHLGQTTSIIFETQEIHNASPAIVSHCGLIFCGPDVVPHSVILESWLQSARSRFALSSHGLTIIQTMAKEVFKNLLPFMKKSMSNVLEGELNSSVRALSQNHGVLEITSFCNLLSALFENYIPKSLLEKTEEFLTKNGTPSNRSSRAGGKSSKSSSASSSVGRRSRIQSSKSVAQPSQAPAVTLTSESPRQPPSRLSSASRQATTSKSVALGGNDQPFGPNHPAYLGVIKSCFAVAATWGFGGSLDSAYRETFSQKLKHELTNCSYPMQISSKALMFDLQVDMRQGGLTKLPVRILEKKQDGHFPFMIVPEVESLYYIVKMLLNLKLPVFITGAAGVGKTSFLQAVVAPKLGHVRIPLMETGETKWFQQCLDNYLHGAKRDNAWFFIDDLHLPTPNKPSQQVPTIWDFLRQAMTYRYYHSSESFIAKKMGNVNFLAAGSIISKNDSGLSSGEKTALPARLTRLFTVLHMVVPSPDSIFAQYFKPIYDWILQFPNYAVPHSTELACALVEGLVTLHFRIHKTLKLSPSKGYYFFSLHDIPKVLNGIFLMIPKKENAMAAVKLPPVPGIADVALSVMNPEGDIIENDTEGDEKEETASEVSSSLEEESVHTNKKSKQLKKEPVTKQSRKATSQKSDNAPSKTQKNEVETGPPSQTLQIDEISEAHSTEQEDSLALASAAQKEVGKAVSWMEAQEVAAHLMELVRTVVRLWIHECCRTYADRLSSKEDRHWFKETILSIIHTNFCAEAEVEKPSNHSFASAPDVYSRFSGLLLFGISEAYSQPLYHGPLISFSELMGQDNEVFKGIFTCHLMKSVYQKISMPCFSGYIEYQSGQVHAGLVLLLNEFNAVTNQNLGIVFFAEMIQHIARLARILQMSQGHAVLLGEGQNVGRSTCVKLAAHAASIKVFSMKFDLSTSKTISMFKELVLEASKMAGIEKKQVVLEIKEMDDDQNMYLLQSASQLMKEGFLSDLYDLEGMTKIAKLRDPHRPRLSWSPAVIQRVFQAYLADVKQNLHVVVSVTRRPTAPLFIKRSHSYTNIFKLASSVDFYEQWSMENLKEIALTWLKSTELEQSISWHPLQKANQIESVAEALACCHLYMCSIFEKHIPDRSQFISINTYHEYLNAFTVLTYSIQKSVKSDFELYAGALEKVHETFATIAEYTDRLIKLIPKHRDQTQTVRKKKLAVDEANEALKSAQEILKTQEQKVEAMMKPLEEKEQKTMSEFAKANPVYDAALKAVQTLTVASIDEIRSYRNPPTLVKSVIQMLTVLFKMPPTWESSKQLLISEGFFDMLLYFDKENISDSVYKKLTRFCDDPETTPQSVAKCSFAAMAICQWIHAVHVYHTVYRKITPMMHSLDQAKEELNEVILIGLYLHINMATCQSVSFKFNVRYLKPSFEHLYLMSF